MGPALCVWQGDDEVRYTHRRLSTRSLKTVFGTVEIVRMGYSHAGANSIYPLDAALALPARVFSYELQRRWSRRRCRVPSRNPLMASPTSPACRFRSAAWKTCWWMRPETDVIRNASRRRPHFGGGGQW